MQASSKYGASKPVLASRANYNLGNLAFSNEDYQSALGLYKQALRLNPDDNDARRNLRITQLKLQNQNQDKDKDKNQKQNQDQNKDQDKDQNKDKDKDQNKDQNKEDKQDKQNQPQQNNSGMSPEAAKQILQAMENKENQTRNRLVNQQQNGKPGSPSRAGRKNW